MKTHLRKNVYRTLAIFFSALALLWTAGPIQAEGETIRVISSSVTSEFPEGVRFRLEASSDSEITSIAVRFRAGQQTYGAYNYLEFEVGELVDSQLLWRTNSSARFIPPGTIITYNFEIENAAGDLLETESQEFIYYDARFEWHEVSEGPVAVAYHGPVKSRANTILDVILQTLTMMGPVLGADITIPIRVTMYNNVKEMLEALPPRSATVGRELVTEGQAFSDFGMLLVLGGGRLANGTASHEVTHILNDRAGVGIFRRLPAWLNEGLAEYGNVEPGFTYDIALEFALGTERLLPIVFMNALPGHPEDAIIFYGQSRSMVRFMVQQSGPDTMREFLATLKSGASMDDALVRHYGVDRLGIYNMWRASVGAPPYEPPVLSEALPTAIPLPTVLPYSLTPQPQATGIESKGATPTPSPEPSPTPTATPEAVAVVTGPEATATPEPAEAAPSAGCGAPLDGGPGAVDMSSFALLAGLAGLGLRRRLKR